MAEPLKIVRRLDEVTTDYAVFERDQVLTEDQLNSVTEYLDDQSRLTRTQLLGIGIVGGLWPTLIEHRLKISAGIAVTSDGDLMRLATDTVFDRWLPYDETAPAYEPFYVGGSMLPLVELLPEHDAREGRSLDTLAGGLKGKLAIAFMESYENDSDLCSGGNCDNRGRVARNTQRLLLIDRAPGARLGLAAELPTGADLAARLPRVRPSRAQPGSGQGGRGPSSAAGFAARYRSAAASTLKALSSAVETLNAQLAQHAAAALPATAEWSGRLQARIDALPAASIGVQYFHAHAKDLACAWEALCDALRADDSVLAPAAGAFPKHVLLGALAEPALLRTGCHPAPWLVDGSAARARVVAAMELFDALLAHFALPDAHTIKITPSRRETAALGERAIPAYYAASAELRQRWNPARSARDAGQASLGYHWMPTPEEADPDDPFAFDQGAVDFYRIEGFLGKQAKDAEAAIRTLVRQRNLPIAVMSALAHSTWLPLMPRLPSRKSSLHSLHYLLRQDLASHLSDNLAYSRRLIEDLKAAGDSIVKSSSTLNVDYVKPVEAARAQLEQATRDLVGSAERPGPLTARSYERFKAAPAEMQLRLSEVLVSTAYARSHIGEVTRTDVASPMDAFVASKSHLWVSWLDELLKKREGDAKDRRLLGRLVHEHPGLEHGGGAAPGGTFVLVCNDRGEVIGDLMLPYWIDDNDEADAAEPALTVPDIQVRLPVDLQPIKINRPLEVILEQFAATKILPRFETQHEHNALVEKWLQTVGAAAKPAGAFPGAGPVPRPEAPSKDPYLSAKLNQVELLQQQIDEMSAVQADRLVSDDVRKKAAQQLEALENRLVDALGETARYFAIESSEEARFDADKPRIYATLGKAAQRFASAQASAGARARLKKDVADIAKGALEAGGSAAQVGSELTRIVFRFG